MKKVMVVFGTRPEAIKMCPVVQELKKRKEIETTVCVTGQHKEMLQQVLDNFNIVPEYRFNIMKKSQTLYDITTLVMNKIKQILIKEQPDVVLVHGDTSTAFAVALACYYSQISVGHVEAGLRTYNIYSPYPEEFNRQAISIISKWDFAPTDQAKNNLLHQGKREEQIFVTGNTVIDALKITVKEDYKHPLIEWTNGSKLILLTAHRRENIGENLSQMLYAVKEIVEKYENVKVIYPVHMNPVIHRIAYSILGKDNERIKLVDPLNVIDFHNIMARAYLVLTDSGGIQEEAPALGVPVLVMRNTTERPEGILSGTLKLIGTKKNQIVKEVSLILQNEKEHMKMAKAINPYGDGNASEKIVDILIKKI